MAKNQACCAPLETQVDAELFAALCDATRIALIGRLASAGRPLTVTEASSCCGIHFSGVSRHLAILLRAGVVQKQKQGREVFYELESKKLASTLRGVADALDALAKQGKQAAA